jgi:uncharacterized protein YydD (DUF2326 family)
MNDRDHEQEWRQFLISEIKEIRSDLKEVKAEMNTLKVKVAGFAAFLGSIVSMIVNKFMGHS